MRSRERKVAMRGLTDFYAGRSKGLGTLREGLLLFCKVEFERVSIVERGFIFFCAGEVARGITAVRGFSYFVWYRRRESN